MKIFCPPNFFVDIETSAKCHPNWLEIGTLAMLFMQLNYRYIDAQVEKKDGVITQGTMSPNLSEK